MTFYRLWVADLVSPGESPPTIKQSNNGLVPWSREGARFERHPLPKIFRPPHIAVYFKPTSREIRGARPMFKSTPPEAAQAGHPCGACPAAW